MCSAVNNIYTAAISVETTIISPHFSFPFLSNFNRKTPYCKYCTTKMLTKKNKLTILGNADKCIQLLVF